MGATSPARPILRPNFSDATTFCYRTLVLYRAGRDFSSNACVYLRNELARARASVFSHHFFGWRKISSAAAGLICRSKSPRTEGVAVGIAALISTPRRWGELASCSVHLSVAQ